MSAIEHALLAVLAADGGDTVVAQGHISLAQRETRTTARRDRQVVEIASLVVAGDRARAAGLAYEHLTEFPGDGELLAHVALRPGAAPSGHHATTTRGGPTRGPCSHEGWRLTGAGRGGRSAEQRSTAMGIDDVKGKVKEAAGDLTDNEDLEREGKVDQAADTVKDKVNDVKDKIGDVVNRDK